MAQDKLLVACPQCLTANRVPAVRLGENPKCGKCGAPLLDGRPLPLDEARFDAFITRTIPTLILFRGGRETARVSGAMDARSIVGWLESQKGA